MKFYSIRGDRPGWGDYGDILAAGMQVTYEMAIENMTEEMKRIEDLESKMQDIEFCVLWRTGPYCPNITFPSGNNIVVTENAMNLFYYNFEYIGFNPVIKGKVVDLPWETWDRDILPPIGPPHGEPESYLFDFPHSQETSDIIGNLYHLELPLGCIGWRSTKPNPDKWNTQYDLYVDTWNGADFFYIDPLPGLSRRFQRAHVITEVGRQWLADNNLDQYIKFNDNCTIVSGMPDLSLPGE